ncbi:hypothetical protein H5410_058811 [Solanum commersonii]|uniref:Uncharacterized protein n=1 Tax=Solanum commersonii TaxID=4109 RepID=A0A9J5W0N4_SOLCO|nr:hypothetical protein H5410_058811 [Solanum commersonii]
MEYLQRELEEIKFNKDFKYHPRCKKLEVVHICFVDDLFDTHICITQKNLEDDRGTVKNLIVDMLSSKVKEGSCFVGKTLPSKGYRRVTRALWYILLVWLGINRTIGSWQDELDWVTIWARKKIEKGATISCVFDMLVYLVWGELNAIQFQSNLYQSDKLCKEIVLYMHVRERDLAKWKIHYKRWIDYLEDGTILLFYEERKY